MLRVWPAAALVLTAVIVASSSGASAARARALACVPTEVVPFAFEGVAYRQLRATVRLRRGAVAGDVFADLACRDVVIRCTSVACVEIDEPARLEVVRLRGVRPSVAVAEASPSPRLYVRGSLCRGAGRGAALLRCLVRVSRRAPVIASGPARGRADLRLDLAASADGRDSWVAVATVRNDGPAAARNVAVSFGGGSTVIVRTRSADCDWLPSCRLGTVPAGGTRTVWLGFQAAGGPFALGAAASSATADADLADNRAFVGAGG